MRAVLLDIFFVHFANESPLAMTYQEVAPFKNAIRVVLAMNDISEREFVQKCLQRMNCIIFLCDDLSKLRATIIQNRPDALLIDYNFGQNNAIETLSNVTFGLGESPPEALLLVPHPVMPSFSDVMPLPKWQWTHKPFYCVELRTRLDHLDKRDACNDPQ